MSERSAPRRVFNCQVFASHFGSAGGFLQRRDRSRAFEFGLAELGDPDAGVDVVEVDVAVPGLRAPGEREIRAETPGVAGPEAGNFAALRVEVATKFARNIQHAA